jgi:hypothetical protein
MFSFDPAEKAVKSVKSGTYLYDDTVLCDVRIVYSTTCPGSGDWEAPLELANDRDGEFFSVQWGSTTARGAFNAGSGGWATIDKAIAAAESMPGVGRTIVWLD